MADANHPIDKVSHLQRQLYLAAKRSPRRRFHALYDRIARRDVLARASGAGAQQPWRSGH